MTEDRFTDFDLEVRSVMEDAREEVPSRLWDSVAGSLDRIERRGKVVSPWWGRAAAGISAAAAAIAAVFFFGTSNNSNIQHITEGETIAGTVQEAPLTTAEKEEPVQVVKSPAKGKTLIAQAFTAGESENERTFKAGGRETCVPAAAEDVTPREDAAPEAVRPPVNPDTQDSPAQAVETAETAAATETSQADPFAVMEFMDGKKKSRGRTSIVAGSNFETNSFDASGAIRRRFLPTVTPAKTSVTELSESTYGIPLSFGLGVRIPVSRTVSIGTGLQYSMLSRSFRGVYTPVENGKPGTPVISDIKNAQHYIGVPLNVYCNLVNGKSVMLYVFGGGTVEKALTDTYRIKNEPENLRWSRSVKGVQASAAVGLGVEFRIAKGFGIYVDPALRYYFDCDQPESIRTRQPLMMNLDLGLRFDIGR